MGIFNHISKKSGLNIQSGTISFDLVFSDYVKNDDLDNYYKKSEPLVMSNTIDMSGNRITTLGDPTEAPDAVNRNFLHRRISAATRDIKTEFTTTLSDLTKTNKDKVGDLESKIINVATALVEMNKNIKEQITIVTNTLEALNKKDTLTTEEIKSINNTLTTTLKDIETKMNDFNIKFTDTEELQSEITKFKNEQLNSVTSKSLADSTLIKTDLNTIKTSNDELKEKVRVIDNKNLELNVRISDIDKKIGGQNTKTTTEINELKSCIEETNNKIKTFLTGLIKDLYNNNKELKPKTEFIDVNNKIDELKGQVRILDENKYLTLSARISDIEFIEFIDVNKKIVYLDNKIKEVNDQTTTKLTTLGKKPLQFPIKIASITADKLKIIDIFNISDKRIFKYKKIDPISYFTIEDKSIRFNRSGSYIIHIYFDEISFITGEHPQILFKCVYNLNKEVTKDLSNKNIKIMFNINERDQLSFDLEITDNDIAQIFMFVMDIYYIESLQVIRSI